jgi:hypothetical protein
MKQRHATSAAHSRSPRHIASLLLLLWFAATGAAADYNLGTLFTDLWWKPTESGWGVNVDHQDQQMFLTYYIYGSNGAPYWVTALLVHSPATRYTFTGDLYESHGTWFGGTYVPGNWGTRKVGTAAFTATDLAHATLTYTVDGTPVSKVIERFTIQNLNYSGAFVGTMGYVTSACAVPADNNEVFADVGLMTITHGGSSLSIKFEGMESTCTLGGTYAQTGRYGSAKGSVSCADGSSGTFELAGMEWTLGGMTTMLQGHSAGCTFTGAITGLMFR